MHGTSQRSFEFGSIILSFFLQICFACTSYGVSCSVKQGVTENDQEVP